MMKYLSFITACLLPFAAQSLEFKVLHENDATRVFTIKLESGEEVDWHRDEFPRTVFGLQGGTINRIEEDGTSNTLIFPTGQAIYLEADPVGQKHRGVNTSPHALELIVIEYRAHSDH